MLDPSNLRVDLNEETPASGTQVGGKHYREMAIQPVEFIHANSIPFIEGSVIKYVWQAPTQKTASRTLRRRFTSCN